MFFAKSVNLVITSKKQSFYATQHEFCPDWPGPVQIGQNWSLLGQLVDPDWPDQPTRPNGPIWGISIKCGNFFIFALERVVDTINFNVFQSCDTVVITLKKYAFYATQHKFYNTLYRPGWIGQQWSLLGQLVNPTDWPDWPDWPDWLIRPTGSIWGISIKCGILMIFAL